MSGHKLLLILTEQGREQKCHMFHWRCDCCVSIYIPHFHVTSLAMYPTSSIAVMSLGTPVSTASDNIIISQTEC
jgi:hypothetical protein